MQGLGFRKTTVCRKQREKWPQQQLVDRSPSTASSREPTSPPLLFLLFSDLKPLESLLFQGTSINKSRLLSLDVSISNLFLIVKEEISFLIRRIRRESVFLSSLIPVHTATASARLVSKLPRESSMLSEGNSSSTPLELQTLGMKAI